MGEHDQGAPREETDAEKIVRAMAVCTEALQDTLLDESRRMRRSVDKNTTALEEINKTLKTLNASIYQHFGRG